MPFLFCFVCNARVPIFEELLFQLSLNEQDGSAPSAATLSSLGTLQEVWARMQHRHPDSNTSHPPLPVFKQSTCDCSAVSAPVRHRNNSQLLLPCDSHEECLDSMGSVWGSFKPAAGTKRIHSSFLLQGSLESREQMFHPK